MKVRLLLYSCLLAAFSSFAQVQPNQPQALKIGDHIPDFVFENIKNSPKKTLNASRLYSNGLLIINFWATWCVPCVREQPLLNELQKKYTGKFTMICITNESNLILDDYLKKHKELDSLKFLTGDAAYKKYFPHTIVPHNIWIDKNGIITAITGDEEISEKNIAAFIAGQTKLNTKQEDLKFDWQKTLSVADTEFLYRSIITPHKNIGNAGVLNLDSTERKTRLLAWNRTRTDLLWLAFMRRAMLHRDWKLVNITASDSSKYFYPTYISESNWTRVHGEEYKAWSLENQFCYELSFNRKADADQVYSIMQKDLQAFFNVSAKVEYKNTLCWVITGSNFHAVDTVKSGNTPLILQLQKNTLIARHQTINNIASRLSDMYPNEPPFVNQSGSNQIISFSKDFPNLDQGLTIDLIKDYFNKMGLCLNLKEVKFPNLLIRDEKN